MMNDATMTTLSTAGAVPFRENRLLQILCCLFATWTLFTAARPEQAFDYWLENALSFTFVAILWGSYRYLTLSGTSYTLIFAFLCLHVWGAQYKYSDVPAGEWLKPWLETERNHYDRIMHFLYGLLLAYPMQEWFVRSAGVRRGFFQYFLPIQFTMACSAVYELMEAGMAFVLSPERGEEFVGMQGDIWDAQKDMFVAGLGAVIAMVTLGVLRRRREVVLTRADRPVLAARSALAGK
jgi:putative membrane protein